MFNRTIERRSSAVSSFGSTRDGQAPVCEDLPGRLLIAADAIASGDYLCARGHCLTTGSDLGDYLTESELVSLVSMGRVINLLILLRNKEIDREQALKMAAMLSRGLFVEPALKAMGLESYPRIPLRLGELLELSGHLSLHVKVLALEISVHQKRKLGDLLVGLSYLDRKLLESAVMMQYMVKEGGLSCEMASAMLVELGASGLSLESFFFSAIERKEDDPAPSSLDQINRSFRKGFIHKRLSSCRRS